jgi:SAM-dependent methyltransferase
MSRAPVPGTLQLFRLLFPQLAVFTYVHTLRRVLRDCSDCLDVGCGASSPTRFVNLMHTVGVDAHPPTLAQARAHRTHDDLRPIPAQEIDRYFPEASVDCVVALDLIEHLTKEEGVALIAAMERIARKKVVLFTPNGYLHQLSHEGDLQEHRSGWNVEEMERLGFRVVGMHGCRALRGEQHRLRIRPRLLGGLLAVASHHLYTRTHPDRAAALLCIKDRTA